MYPCCAESGRAVCPQHAQQAEVDAAYAHREADRRDLPQDVVEGATA